MEESNFKSTLSVPSAPSGHEHRESINQAKPNCQQGAETCAKSNSTSPCLLGMTASLGSITDTLTLTGEYANANDFEVRLRALTGFAKK
jgi:hypothetical protein